MSNKSKKKTYLKATFKGEATVYIEVEENFSIENLSEEERINYYDKLYEKTEDVLVNWQIDEERIEVVKSNIFRA